MEEEDFAGAFGTVYRLFFSQRRRGAKDAEGRGKEDLKGDSHFLA